MNTKTKIYIGLIIAAIVVTAIAGASLRANRKIAKLEREVEAARHTADEAQKAAAMREIEAAEYKAKIEYLEGRIVMVQTMARKKDEELEKLNSISVRARRDVERARSSKPDTATDDQLCAKLAELGYGCEQE
ncbi:MAG: hypothetical protein AB7J13_01320 [Pyrinomonadaceae bacterium]